MLAKLAIVPQRIMNSYTDTSLASAAYQEGDFVANVRGCARDPKRDCEAEMKPLISQWREKVQGEGR